MENLEDTSLSKEIANIHATIAKRKDIVNKYMNEDLTIAVIHDGEEIGEQWKTFIEEIFTVDLPESYRDMRLDILTENMMELGDDEVCNVIACPWRMFLFSHAMLEALRNSESLLSRSDVVSNNPERNIILILGEKDDTSFTEQVRRSLYVFPNFSNFHLIQATNPEKIFSDVIAIVSPLYIVFHPNIISAEDTQQHVTLIANKAYPFVEGLHFIVVFDDGTETMESEATLFNPCTLLLQNRGHHAGMVDARLYASTYSTDDGGNEVVKRSQLGETMKVWFQSDLDRVNAALDKSLDPFSFLCQSLKLKPGSASAAERVDEVLTDSFRKNVPDHKLATVFGTDQGVDGEGYEDTSKQLTPTLLHFAAMHGLCNLTALLLRCPGSVRAFGTANCDGDYPTNLAEKFNHWELKNYMNSYMEVSAMVDTEMGDSRTTSQMVAKMVTGQYVSLTECETGDVDEQPTYLAMKPLPMSPRSMVEMYDTPFKIPIPLVDDMPTYDSVLARMIESEDPYTMLNQAEENIYEVNPQPVMRQQALNYRNDEFSSPPLLPRSSIDAEVSPKGADVVTYSSLEMPLNFPIVSSAQRELIQLQQKVKKNELTTNQAVIRFKEWERKHKEQAASFQFQQECLQRLRNSLVKSQEAKRQRGESGTLIITPPIAAGSSTYHKVLKKATGSDPVEAQYGISQKQKKFGDGFSRNPSLRSVNDSSCRSESIKSSASSTLTRPLHTAQEDVLTHNIYTSEPSCSSWRSPKSSAPPIPPREPPPPQLRGYDSRPPYVPQRSPFF